ncbi:MAG: DUF2608 domain-containing protein [Rickettsiaceae bacterium]
MIKYINIFFLLLVYLYNINTIAMPNHTITNVDNAAPIHQFLLTKNLNQDCLVIFDIDYVLIMPDDDYSLSRNAYRKQLWQELISTISKEEQAILSSIVKQNATWSLMESTFKDILDLLKNHHIPTLALTSFGTGAFGVTPKLEDLRIKQLTSVGIDFNQLSPIKHTTILHHLKGEHGAPMITSGVILTAELDKGIVLQEILEKSNYYPKEIIFIDDTLKNLHSVQKYCSLLQIPFSGFHYTKIDTLPKNTVNKAAEKLKMHILYTQHKWLTSEEAQ